MYIIYRYNTMVIKRASAKPSPSAKATLLPKPAPKNPQRIQTNSGKLRKTSTESLAASRMQLQPVPRKIHCLECQIDTGKPSTAFKTNCGKRPHSKQSLVLEPLSAKEAFYDRGSPYLADTHLNRKRTSAKIVLHRHE